MRSPADWLAAQVAERPDDFAPEEMAAPLAWIASIQADAVSSERERCAGICDAAKAKADPENNGAVQMADDLACVIRAIPEADWERP